MEEMEEMENMDVMEEETEDHGSQCCICGSNKNLLLIQDKQVCEKCLHIGIDKLTFPWKESLQKLFKEYFETCNRCIAYSNPEDVHQARIIGRKIRAMLEFMGLPKKHKLLLPIKEIHRLLNKIREADVFLVKIKQQSEENDVYLEIPEVVLKRQKKQKKIIAEKIPVLLDESFHHKVETFINNELLLYIVQLDKENVMNQNEEQFNWLVDAYRQSAIEKGKTSPDTIKALHAIRKKSKSLRYIYSFLNDTFENHYQDKESYYKNLQSQFGEIKDIEDFLHQIKVYQKKIHIPNDEMDPIKKEFKARLRELLENVEGFEEPVPEL